METARDAERLIRSIINGMRQVAWDGNPMIAESGDGSSPMKDKYGDTWTFMFGVHKGYHLVHGTREREVAWTNAGTLETVEDKGVTFDEWEDHYDDFGSGAYGRGLLIGRRLATYSGTDYDFVESTDDDTTEFTFTDESSEDKFTFVQ